ncbi:hypothetical protein JW964_03920 [candidate division KSB1 bacterium]|nr:hypothetical protein [candidate division KSB1 bacterium]
MKKIIILASFVGISLLIILSCSTDKSPLASKAHPEGWNVTTSEVFHGEKVLASLASGSGLTSCKSCHGQNFDGGESQVACATCHKDYPHPLAWTMIKSSDNHGHYIKSEKWSMERCKSCHGADYSGGKSGSSCFHCHKEEQGPEACNVCHGSQKNFAPPEDTENNVETTALGVGAHQVHIDKGFGCSICHVVPTTLASPGHLDDTPHAEVLPTWTWDREKATCGRSCHTNPEKTYIWNNF